jgi:hypothetical protein
MQNIEYKPIYGTDPLDGDRLACELRGEILIREIENSNRGNKKEDPRITACKEMLNKLGYTKW